jgi:hypothetical protein
VPDLYFSSVKKDTHSPNLRCDPELLRETIRKRPLSLRKAISSDPEIIFLSIILRKILEKQMRISRYEQEKNAI